MRRIKTLGEEAAELRAIVLEETQPESQPQPQSVRDRIMESLERITKIAELNYKESVNSLRDTLEKQLLHLMPLLRGTNNHNEIIELEAKITKITRELKDNKDV